jgi:hypothetical protein
MNYLQFLEKLQHRNNTCQDGYQLELVENQVFNMDSKLSFRCVNNHITNIKPLAVITPKRLQPITYSGCLVCANSNRKNKFKKSNNQFIDEANSIFMGLYDYSEVEYTNNKKKVTIICKQHGQFDILPTRHLQLKKGCPICEEESKTLNKLRTFIKKANKIHNKKYNYSNVVYKNTYTNVGILCPVHGEFFQEPRTHIRGHGCPSCASVSFSKKQIMWLEYIIKTQGITIHHALNSGEIIIPNTNYRADGYCPETNTVYEFHGDAFHGNLTRYNASDICHPYNNKTAQELYDDTMKKESEITSMGYNLVSIWESDFDKLGIDITIGDIDNKPRILIEDISYLGIKLIDEFLGYKKKHKFECLTCGNDYITTLSALKQRHDKYNKVGCPKCPTN